MFQNADVHCTAIAAAIVLGFSCPAGAAGVQLTGLIDGYAGIQRLSGMSAHVAAVGAGGMSTSWFGFTGTEDLGGGLQAEFALTSFFKPDTGMQGRFATDTLFSRDANIGLKGRFGAIRIGANTSPNFFPTVRFNPFGNSTVVSPLLLHSYVKTNGDLAVWSNAIAGDTGWSNQVSYTTPTLAGFTMDLHYQFGETAGRPGRNNVGARASFVRGPLALAAYVQRVQVNNPLDTGAPLNAPGAPASQRAAFLGASFDTGMARLYGTVQGAKGNPGIRDRTFQLGAAIPAGGGAFLASWAGTRRAGVAGAARLARDTVSLGYDLYLSKRTDLYAVCMVDHVTRQDHARTVIAGIRHRF